MPKNSVRTWLRSWLSVASEKLYPTRHLIPAVMLKHQPKQAGLWKWQHRRGEVFIQWRWPWDRRGTS
jgi:hypothetical protein